MPRDQIEFIQSLDVAEQEVSEGAFAGSRRRFHARH